MNMRPPGVEKTHRPDTILVTGASTGLGLALAQKLLRTDYRVILTARESSLPRLAAAGIAEGDLVILRALDVTSAAERRRVVEEANERWNGIDILVNNAGIAYRSVVEHFDETGETDQMRVNFSAPMELIRLVLPGMRERRRGRIINVSSVGGMMAMPTMSLYSASKFALEGASEALWYEVRPWNIKVTLVEPGFIRSESFRNTRYTENSRAAMNDPSNPYHAHYANMAALIARLMNFTVATPQKVADEILRILYRKNPPLRLPATWDAHVFALLRRLLPRRVYHWILYGGLPRLDAVTASDTTVRAPDP